MAPSPAAASIESTSLTRQAKTSAGPNSAAAAADPGAEVGRTLDGAPAAAKNAAAAPRAQRRASTSGSSASNAPSRRSASVGRSPSADLAIRRETLRHSPTAVSDGSRGPSSVWTSLAQSSVMDATISKTRASKRRRRARW